jgi:integrase
VNFHILRHTHGSHLAMNGVPLGVIAAQLGHADTRMTEKHYAHLYGQGITNASGELKRDNLRKPASIPASRPLPAI